MIAKEGSCLAYKRCRLKTSFVACTRCRLKKRPPSSANMPPNTAPLLSLRPFRMTPKSHNIKNLVQPTALIEDLDELQEYNDKCAKNYMVNPERRRQDLHHVCKEISFDDKIFFEGEKTGFATQQRHRRSRCQASSKPPQHPLHADNRAPTSQPTVTTSSA